MNRYVADTHALFWYLTASPRLGRRCMTGSLSAWHGGWAQPVFRWTRRLSKAAW